jgi:uncharacterized protein (DUF952 family)
MSGKIFHITSRQAWQEAQAAGRYSAPSLAAEGFIHCSTRSQVGPVAEKYYRGQTGLVVLVIDTARLGARVKWEAPFDGAPPRGVAAAETFPHIYGPVEPEAVVQVLDLEPAADGSFILPALP